MKVIQSASEKIAKLWPDGTPGAAVYRLFSYVISEQVSGGLLLLNTVTGALVFLDDREAARLSRLPCDHAPWMDALIRGHFLAKAGSDDRKIVDTLRRSLELLGASEHITDYTVLPTTECNARCFYCYECGIKRENMQDETADRFVEFADANRGGAPIRIAWFGGEPLLGMRRIDYICDALRQREIPFRSTMTSNGYLFDEDRVGHAVEAWNLEEVQITLDGTEEVYNRVKAYVHPCESPYRRVLDNIGCLLRSGVRVQIRLNLGLHNADDLSVLVEEIAARFPDKTGLIVYPHLLFDGCGADPVRFTGEELAALLAKQSALQAQVCRYAPVPYRAPLPQLSVAHCTVGTSAVVVFPSGKLGKCQHFADSHFVGDLEHGITEPQKIALLRERSYFPKCDRCPIYPACEKLKHCEINHSCQPLNVEYRIKETVQYMHLYYMDYLDRAAAAGGTK